MVVWNSRRFLRISRETVKITSASTWRPSCKLREAEGEAAAGRYPRDQRLSVGFVPEQTRCATKYLKSASSTAGRRTNVNFGCSLDTSESGSQSDSQEAQGRAAIPYSIGRPGRQLLEAPRLAEGEARGTFSGETTVRKDRFESWEKREIGTRKPGRRSRNFTRRE